MKVFGVDIGTMFIVAANEEDNSNIAYNSIRNVYVPVSEDFLDSNKVSNLEYVKILDDDGECDGLFIISEDAYTFSNAFGKKVFRPMYKGVISSDNVADGGDILKAMCEKLIGKNETNDGVCVYSIPASPIDIPVDPNSVLYHEKVFEKIFNNLGYKSKPINEALAVVFSECGDNNFTGVGISFGAGLVNICVAYRGVPVMSFALSKSGDWIDENAAASLKMIPNRITKYKESSELDLVNGFKANKKNKKDKEKSKAFDAITYYYEYVIDYTLKNIVNEFNNHTDIEIDEEIPIILSGGTTKPKGFVELFKKKFKELDDFPFNVGEIKTASDPLNAVATGCLMSALTISEKD